MARPNVDSIRATRLRKVLPLFLRGDRPVANPLDAKLLLEAVTHEPQPAVCVESILGNQAGLHAIRQSVRVSIDKTFVCEYVLPLLSYLSHPDVKAICDGSLLQQLIVAIVEPPTAWNNIVELYSNKDPNFENEFAAELFAWLCLQIVAHPGTVLTDAAQVVKATLDKRPLLSLPWTKPRETGYQINKVLDFKSRVESSSVTDAVRADGPGGRHDNDFLDFREIQIYPTTDEFSSTLLPFYRTAEEVAATSSAKRTKAHLDNQFRLLREDMLGELRNDVNISLEPKKARRRSALTLTGLRLVGINTGDQSRGQFCSLAISVGGGKGLGIVGKDDDARKTWLKNNPNFLRHQTFGAVCIGNNPIGFAFVVRDIDNLARSIPVVGLRFTNTDVVPAVLRAFQSNEPLQFVVVDTPVFAYEPVLKRLKEITDIPLGQQLLQLEMAEDPSEKKPPHFNRCLPGSVLRSLDQTEENVKIAIGGEKYELDSAQARALQSALVASVSVIQGPPGTGKSFIGALAAKVLLGSKSAKLLVLAYTNHALDQFLVDLRNVGIDDAQMVRLGSKPSSATEHLSFETQLRASKTRRSHASYLRLGLLRQESQHLRSSLDSVFAKLTRRTMPTDIMEYLEFAEDPELNFYWSAFQVPVLDDGFVLAGQAGDTMRSDYLIQRWIANQDAGPLRDYVTSSCQRIWAMSQKDRDNILQEWQSAVWQDQITVVTDLMAQLDSTQRQIDEIFNEGRHELIRNKRIVGCTTTAAAKYSSLLAAYQPGCVLVEEAGEIMEAHILTALSSSTEKVILIGDHKQLRPKCNNYALSVEKGDGYDINRSLFERLILHGHPFATLRKQHRMDPQISQIVRSMTYPDLLDDEVTFARSATRGIRGRVSFINHSHPEGQVREIGDRRDAESTSSKENRFEAQMILKLVKYLAQQGYRTEQVVVLTPYLGQLRLLRDMLVKENDPWLSDMDSAELLRAGLITQAAAQANKTRIRLSTIDNYQGEESDIVIASLTRSNNHGDIGFMKSPERLNVLVSRARNCLIMIGNMETFMSSKQGRQCWTPFFKLFQDKKYLHDGLEVYCERHPEHAALLTKPEDFDVKCPDGGCLEACNAMLKCGRHACTRRCHRIADHSMIVCRQLVKVVCEKSHRYQVLCGETNTECPTCRQERKDIRRRAERDLEIEKQRRERRSQYRQELQDVQDEVNHQKRLLKDAQEEAADKRLLADERATLASLKETVARHEAMKQSEELSQEHLKVKDSYSTGGSDSGINEQATDMDGINGWDQATAEHDWMCMKRDGLSKSAEIDALMRMVGLQTVKRSFLDIKTMVDTSVRQEVSLKDDRFGCSLLGNPGTGKTTVARLYGRFLTSMGVIAGNAFKETTGSKLANAGVSGCQGLIDEVLEDGGGVIFIDEAYQLSSGNSPGGRAVLDFLLAEVENLRSSVCFILAGYAKQMESFFAHNPGFPSRFPLEMRFEDYTDEELLRILNLQVDTKYGGRMRAEDGLKGLYCRIVSRRVGRGRGKEGFGNARAIENELSKIYRRQSKRLEQERRRSKQAPDDLFLSPEDLIGPKPSNALRNSKSWKQLQELIGLGSVKESVKSLVDTIEVNYQRELDEMPLIEYNLNRVFLGNPGTGKTTVAKKYGQILVDLGMLSNGDVIVKNPSDLIGSALGHSEQQTKGLLANTVGKVLVIDEAYGLYGGSSSDPYKTAVVDTIVATVHSTPGDDRCVLLLGYRDQMEEMFQNVNPGLSRRFPLSSAFEFADFNQQELASIVDLKVKQQGFDLTAKAKTVVMGMLDRSRNRPNFGNAGEVDILLNEAKGRHQKRWAAGETKRVSALEALDFDPDYARMERSETNIVQLFKDTVGCERIIATLQGYQETVRRMSVLGLDPKENIPFNFLFRGPPGTGKTTTARRMGKVFYDAGFLASADVLDCSASDVIGQYVGQTGPKVRQMLDKALGRVLLIDEAYRLAEGHYAKEALDEIVDACTKEKYHKRLIIILAGYEDDINRLLNVNPGMTSRFPEVLDFYGLSAKDCLSLLTKKLQQQKLSLEKPGKGQMDLRCMIEGSKNFRATVVTQFETLSSQPNWASARDVESLYKAIFKSALKLSPSGTEIQVSEAIVLNELGSMISERENRGKQSGTQLRDPMQSLSLEQAVPDMPLRKPTITKTVSRQFVEKNEEDISKENIATKKEPVSSRQSRTAIRDAGVSDLIWNQLQADARLEQQREQEYQAKLKAKNEAIDDEIRQKIVSELIEEEARRNKEAEMKKKLELAGRCPVGFAWIRQEAGWRCAGGSHFIGEKDV